MKPLFCVLIITLLVFSCKKNNDSGGGTTTVATITGLNCTSTSFSAAATAGAAYSAGATVPYSGGNGVSYTAGSAVSSTGVTGLTATLQSGTLANGSGNFTYTVSGTPSAAGTASFAISFGGQSCSFSLVVNSSGPGSPSITALACGSGSFSATATAGIAYSATATVPYAGGNGLAYPAGAALSSTGITGLTATLQAGTLTGGNGNLSYSVSGTPSAAGTASFAISFGGQSCTLSLTVNTSGGAAIPAPYNKIYGATEITFDATWIYIKSNGTPDHKSVYYPTSNPLYENFSGTTFGGFTFSKNPNTIASKNYTFKIPRNPAAATTHAATPLGPIGVSLNGVPFFNQYAGPSQPLTNEIVSFDQWWGHPAQAGDYHYHVEPKYLTTVKASSSALLGFLLDGFPVYGPKEENGTDPTGLDVYHGHSHATIDYPAGLYHYHITAAAPYINGNGFWGTSGTVTQ